MPFNPGYVPRLPTFADWAPTQHTASLARQAWDGTRGGLDFYDSTNEYMRNQWAEENLESRLVQVIRQDGGMDYIKLYKSPLPGMDTWHTIDAFQIDHQIPATDFISQNTANASRLEAMQAYNDVGNLRLIPAPTNTSGYFNDGYLRDGGPPSGWVEKKFGFDPDAPIERFVPTKRRIDSYAKDFSLERDGREALSFDNSIKDEWMTGRLRQIYAGKARMLDGTGEEVPLFRCEATGQLATRDALDIDHKRPVEEILQGRKNLGDALDAYNDPANLRLVSSSANRSHEWELLPDGEYYDPDIDNLKRKYGSDYTDLSDFIEDDGGVIPPAARAELDQITSALRRGRLQFQKRARGAGDAGDAQTVNGAGDADPAMSAATPSAASDAAAAGDAASAADAGAIVGEAVEDLALVAMF